MKKIMLFAAACAALAACNKNIDSTTPKSDNPDAFVKGQEVTLAVSAPSSTKVSSSLDATTGDVSFKWETGDKIKVTVGTKSAEFTLSSGAGESSATFKGKMPASGETFDVQYPVADLTNQDLISQTYVANGLPKDKMKMTATECTVGNAFELTPQFAALRLNLWGSKTVGKIEVIKIDTTDPSFTLDCGTGATIGTTEAESTAFFIVVPAGSFRFSAEIFDNAATPASICKFETTSAKTFTAGQILNMPAKEVNKPKFSISYCIDPDISGSFSEVAEAAEGEDVNISFELSEVDYYFHKFEIEADSGASVLNDFEDYNTAGSFTMPASNVTVTAKCIQSTLEADKTQFDVTYEGGEQKITAKITSSFKWAVESDDLTVSKSTGGEDGELTEEEELDITVSADKAAAFNSSYTVKITPAPDTETGVTGKEIEITVSVKAAPEVPLSGKFSVSATKKIQFSKGNLWTNATASPQTWFFEKNQYDYQSTYTASHISHFYWETTGNYGSAQACQTASGSSTDTVDWGVPYCAANNLTAGTWRTLSDDELNYMLETRTVNGGQGDEYCFWQATIRSDVSGGVFGAIIFPDDYTSETSVKMSYTAAEWAALESAGCAFLPNIGVRTGSTIDNHNPYHYWSCIAFDYANTCANCFGYFDLGPKTHAFGVHAENRNTGAAVRLVCDAK